MIMFSRSPHNKSNIQEANRHLELLHTKIADLEEQLLKKETLFEEREKQLSDSMEHVVAEKNAEIRQLKQEIVTKDVELDRISEKLNENDLLISRLQHKCSVLDYIAKHRNVFEEVVSVLSGVERLESKDKMVDNQTSFARELCELSRKTEAHGKTDTVSNRKDLGHCSLAPNIQRPYRTFDGRFSISEMEDDLADNNDSDLPEDVFSKDRELYL